MLTSSLGLFLFIGTCTFMAVLAVDQPVVETNLGLVRGNGVESRDGRKYYQFLGIPYGKAERFQPPRKADSWTDIRDATIFGPVCPQLGLKFKDNNDPKFIGSEDCLNLNVYTPRLPRNDNHTVFFPVLVWLETGGFIAGSGNYYGAKYIMDTDSILVTINSRVGPFGFLNIGDEQAAGNQGLKDQVAALKWVHENIEKFGGDKDRVTIFGHGSGGAAVQYHLLSPLSKGLFHSAISQTGSNLAPWAFALEPFRQGKLLGEKVGCPVDTKENLMNCLKNKTAEELVPLDFKFVEFTGKEKIKWQPSIESINPDEAFLTHNPFVLITEGKIANKVPLILGINNLDGAVPALAKSWSNPAFINILNKEWDAKVPILLDYTKSATDPNAVSKKIRDYYFEGKDVTPENLFRAFDAIADRFFYGPVSKFAITYSDFAPTYAYIITHEGNFSNFDFANHKVNGTAYYDDIQYEFPLAHYGFPEITKESQDYQFSKNLLQLWASFAENGKPAKTWGPEKNWEKFNATIVPFTLYEINSETKSYSLPQDKMNRYALWKELSATVLSSEKQDPPMETF